MRGCCLVVSQLCWCRPEGACTGCSQLQYKFNMQLDLQLAARKAGAISSQQPQLFCSSMSSCVHHSGCLTKRLFALYPCMCVAVVVQRSTHACSVLKGRTTLTHMPRRAAPVLTMPCARMALSYLNLATIQAQCAQTSHTGQLGREWWLCVLMWVL